MSQFNIKFLCFNLWTRFPIKKICTKLSNTISNYTIIIILSWSCAINQQEINIYDYTLCLSYYFLIVNKKNNFKEGTKSSLYYNNNNNNNNKP